MKFYKLYTDYLLVKCSKCISTPIFNNFITLMTIVGQESYKTFKNMLRIKALKEVTVLQNMDSYVSNPPICILLDKLNNTKIPFSTYGLSSSPTHKDVLLINCSQL